MANVSTEKQPLRCVIIGAGVSGIIAGIKLAEAGYTDFTLYEKASRVGGTWRENTYPGVACDVPSHLYSFSFAPNPDWTRQFAPGHEIQAYIEAVARRYGVNERVRFEQEIVSCRFEHGRWQLQTRSGERDVADVVIAATGVTHHPNIPELPGLQTFGGAQFHSARWDHSARLDGQRVGVLGTGSSAVQIVSAIVSQVQKLSLFQRTPQWIMPQENAAYSDEDRAKFRADPAIMTHIRGSMERRFVQNFSDAVIDANSERLAQIETLCREYLESQVVDPALRERLRPNYRAACKRLVISSEFYRAIQQPHAELVTAPIERVERQGVRTRDGVLHPLDVLVLATGFCTDRFVRPIEVVGRSGARLDAAWARRPTAYLCVTVPEFPNFFLLNGPNGPVGNFPLIEVAEVQMNYLLALLDVLRSGSAAYVAPRKESTAAFEAARVQAAKQTVWTSGCSSWYLDDEGVPAAWPWTIRHFREVMAAPKLEDYELSAREHAV